MASGKTGAAAAASTAAAAGAATTALNQAKAAGGTLLKTLNDFAGPLQIAAGLALGFAYKLTFGIGKSETLRRGLEKIARIQYYTPQFAKLLGGLDHAKRRLAEIEKSKAAKVFGFEEAVEGNKRLETLTRGVLSNKAGMALAGDVAAVTGAKFSEVGDILGNLYADIAADRSIDGSVDQLVSLGAVSGAAGDKLKLLQANGASTTQMWVAMQAELAKTKGGLDAAARTMDGLEKQILEAQAANDKAFAAPFEEGKLAGMEAALKLTQALAPAFQTAGKVLSVFYNAMAAVAKGFADVVTAIPILGALLNGLVTGFLALIGILGLFSLVTTVQAVMALGKLAAGMMATASATTFLGAAILRLRTIVNLCLGPWGRLIGIVSFLAGVFASLGSDTGDLGAMQEDLKNKVDETTKSLRDQIAAVQTQGEKNQVIADANKQVIEKKDKFKKANEAMAGSFWGDGGDSDKKVKAAEEELRQAKDDLDKAWKKNTDAAMEGSFGDDYKAVAEESKKRMQDLQAEMNAAANPEARQDVATRMTAEAARDLKSEADRRFQRRQVMGDSQVAAMREVGKRTGDRGMLDRADALESKNFAAKRGRELREMGVKGDATDPNSDFSRTLAADTLMNQIDMQQKRGGTPSQSSLASIGGSGGFAGVVNDIPKQTLLKLQQLLGEVQKINGNMPSEDMDKKFEN